MKNTIRTSLAVLAAGATLVFGAATAHADSRVNWSVSIGAPIQPVFVQPAPVYVAQRPAYVQTYAQPVVVRSYAPAPVYVSEPVYYGRSYHKHKHHGRGHDRGHGRGHGHHGHR